MPIFQVTVAADTLQELHGRLREMLGNTPDADYGKSQNPSAAAEPETPPAPKKKGGRPPKNKSANPYVLQDADGTENKYDDVADAVAALATEIRDVPDAETLDALSNANQAFAERLTKEKNTDALDEISKAMDEARAGFTDEEDTPETTETSETPGMPAEDPDDDIFGGPKSADAPAVTREDVLAVYTRILNEFPEGPAVARALLDKIEKGVKVSELPEDKLAEAHKLATDKLAAK